MSCFRLTLESYIYISSADVGLQRRLFFPDQLQARSGLDGSVFLEQGWVCCRGQEAERRGEATRGMDVIHVWSDCASDRQDGAES